VIEETLDGELTPREIVEALDRYIVGQGAAKRAVAIALRNRYRRRLLDDELREEVLPKNILMMGPTGVGKTEIARRLAALARAPFIKVEATKYTEVGYVGRDVESMVRDLVETAIRMVYDEKFEQVHQRAREIAFRRLAEVMEPLPKRDTPRPSGPVTVQSLFQSVLNVPPPSPSPEEQEHGEAVRRRRRELQEEIREGKWDDHEVEIEVEDTARPVVEVFSSSSGMEEINLGSLSDMLGSMAPKRSKKRHVPGQEALEILTDQAARELLAEEDITREAIDRAEQNGIIFIDEIDKIVDRGGPHHGPDVSREGVQRDILPIIEGCTVQTKHGPVRSDHILFIAAGAFHASRVSDLIPELQGRLPIRVELDTLTEGDFVRILTEPRNALTTQTRAMLATEGVDVEFTRSGIQEIAAIAKRVNEQSENIGARRLYTVLERLLEDVSFDAPELSGKHVRIDRSYVRRKLQGDLAADDVGRFIL